MSAVSDFVAGALENTANELPRFSPRADHGEAILQGVA